MSDTDTLPAMQVPSHPWGCICVECEKVVRENIIGGTVGEFGPPTPFVGPPAKPHYLRRVGRLRDEFKLRVTPGGFKDVLELEWARIGQDARIVSVLVAGLEHDDLSALAQRLWCEFNEPEQQAIRAAMRHLRRGLGEAAHLVGRWE